MDVSSEIEEEDSQGSQDSSDDSSDGSSESEDQVNVLPRRGNVGASPTTESHHVLYISEDGSFSQVTDSYSNDPDKIAEINLLAHSGQTGQNTTD